MNKYYITESLGEVQKKTPEGYLLCVGVPIARTGEQEYGVHEMPDFDGRDDGIIVCERPPEVVFSDETIASFEGKPFVVGHPSEDVTIDNWNQHAAGIVQNVRKGGGNEDDLLIADILVTVSEAIEEIERGVREISCGYDGDYEQIEPGRIRLREIIGNHVALVEAGRAGHRVAIGDEARDKGGKEKKIAMKTKFWDWLKEQLKKAKDEGIVLEISPADEADPETEDTGGGEEIFDAKAAFDTLSARIDSLAGAIGGVSKDEAKEEDSDPEEDSESETEDSESESTKTDDAKMTCDAKPMKPRTVATLDAQKITSFRSQAEILAPGFDTRTMTLDSLSSLVSAKRKVLAEVYTRDEQVRRDLEFMAEGVIRSWSSVEDAAVNTMFAAAAKNKAERNNRGAKLTAKDCSLVGQRDTEGLKKMHNDFWKKNKGEEK